MSAFRAVAGIVVNLPEPAIGDGHPTLPPYWARFSATATAKMGPLHIRAIADPNPVWDPATSGWYVRPPAVSGGSSNSGAGDYRWSVNTLPDPGSTAKGWYWLGDPSAADNTANAPAGTTQWKTDPATPGPGWHSFFPYKPSVSAYDAYIPGERTIHHAKGVHFNSHYIEHMWMDFGRSQLQPCTWIIVATIMSDPFPGYQHNLFDTGRNPDAVGFPRLTGNAVSVERRIPDGLPYRANVKVQPNSAAMITRTPDVPLRVRGAPGHHPRMYAMIFDGAKSKLGIYDPFGQYLSAGKVSSGPSYANRYNIMGRQQGWISQQHASNLLVFEMRYWHHALTADDLAAQYAQLSSTHQFDQYKRL